MNESLFEIFSSVMKISKSAITDDSSLDNIELWDSLRHFHLVSALEEKFDIEFTDNEIEEMHNIKLIKSILNQKISE